MDDIDLPLRRVDGFPVTRDIFWRGPVPKARVRATGRTLRVYSSVFGFMKQTFDVRSEWTVQIRKQTKLDIREGKDGEYFRLVLGFRAIEDCQQVERWLRGAIEVAEIEKQSKLSGDEKGFQSI